MWSRKRESKHKKLVFDKLRSHFWEFRVTVYLHRSVCYLLMKVNKYQSALKCIYIYDSVTFDYYCVLHVCVGPADCGSQVNIRMQKEYKWVAVNLVAATCDNLNLHKSLCHILHYSMCWKVNVEATTMTIGFLSWLYEYTDQMILKLLSLFLLMIAPLNVVISESRAVLVLMNLLLLMTF